MDIAIPLLVAAIFYLGPVLLKYYHENINKQQELQKPSVPEIKAAPPKKRQEIKHAASTTKPQSAAAAANLRQVSSIKEETSPWDGAIDQNMLINGMIFAEILQPPRAYRPFGKK